MTSARLSRLLGTTMRLGALTVVILGMTAFSAAAAGSAPVRPAKVHKRPGGLTKLDVPSLRERMHQARGHDLFVHLWASWCGPCLEELPSIDRLARATRARGATFLSVSLDDPDRQAQVLDILRHAPALTRFVATFQTPEQLLALFGGEWDGSLPALLVYDGGGRLRATFVGALDDAELRRLSGGQAPPDSARH
jgi:thiol-disulfide isomerase/thioredoxin